MTFIEIYILASIVAAGLVVVLTVLHVLSRRK